MPAIPRILSSPNIQQRNLIEVIVFCFSALHSDVRFRLFGGLNDGHTPEGCNDSEVTGFDRPSKQVEESASDTFA
jgi:hypothetical protein